ncbi:MAG: hypothetical protein QOJ94_2275 [Sphingomonadales bacterium]|jgi:hypothetical protein|nr:hypothetical protein [Sphingomonadales bacterium]
MAAADQLDEAPRLGEGMSCAARVERRRLVLPAFAFAGVVVRARAATAPQA